MAAATSRAAQARRRLIAAAVTLVAAGAAVAPAVAPAAPSGCGRWPAWTRFQARYLEAGGRVVDESTPAQSTVSEAQAYALVFALIAGDRAAFRRVLGWTTEHLAAGDLSRSLPAWHWGQREDGSWGVLDPNPAADADLWLAYALLEGARVWRVTAWRATGAALAARILREEVAELPELGPVLLPAPAGFVSDAGWRLNPSYWPLQVLRRLARTTGDRRWTLIADTSRRLLLRSVPHGIAPDWIFVPRGGDAPAPADARGSYSAIRVYLWAGMLGPSSPDRGALLAALRPTATRVAERGVPPEWQDAGSGAAGGAGPPGFSAALLPLLISTRALAAAETQRRLATRGAALRTARYYSDALTLFGVGWSERRYRFAGDGRLIVTRERACAGAR